MFEDVQYITPLKRYVAPEMSIDGRRSNRVQIIRGPIAVGGFGGKALAASPMF